MSSRSQERRAPGKLKIAIAQVAVWTIASWFLALAMCLMLMFWRNLPATNAMGVSNILTGMIVLLYGIVGVGGAGFEYYWWEKFAAMWAGNSDVRHHGRTLTSLGVALFVAPQHFAASLLMY